VSSGERQSEQYLRKLVEILHGVTLEQFDRDGRQRAVDYVFTLPSVTGAVEMTTYRDGRAAAWFDKLNESETFECPSTRGWAVVVRLGTKLDQLRRRLPSVIAACDRHQVDRPEDLPAIEWSADVEWVVSNHLNLYPSAASPPAASECRCQRRWAPRQRRSRPRP